MFSSNEPWNKETHKTDRNPPITNHKPWPFEPVEANLCFLRGQLRWSAAAKKANVMAFELQNSRVYEKRSNVRCCSRVCLDDLVWPFFDEMIEMYESMWFFILLSVTISSSRFNGAKISITTNRTKQLELISRYLEQLPAPQNASLRQNFALTLKYLLYKAERTRSDLAISPTHSRSGINHYVKYPKQAEK